MSHKAYQYSYGEASIIFTLHSKAKKELKLNVNILKRADWTPLMMAALKKKSLNAIRILVEAGADITQRNKDGWTALNIGRISTLLNVTNTFLVFHR